MKTLNLTALLLLFFLSGCTEKPEMNFTAGLSDSVTTYLELANDESLGYDERVGYSRKGLRILEMQKNDSATRSKIFKVANRFYNLGELAGYRKTSLLVLAKAEISGDTLSLAKAYSYLGDYYSNIMVNDSAFYYYSKAEKIYLRINDNSNLGGVFINMARVKSVANDYAGSEELIMKALTVLKDRKDYQREYEAYNILGYISSELSDYRKALESYSLALEIVRGNNLNNSLHQEATLINNIGYVYQNQGKYRIALEYFNRSLKDSSLYLDRPDLYAIIIDNIAYSKLKSNDLRDLPRLFFNSLHLRDSLNLRSATIYSKVHISEYYEKVGDTVLSQKFAEEALSTARQLGKAPDILFSLRRMVAVRKQNSGMLSSEYMQISDSLQKEDRHKQDKFARIQFETDEISLQKDKLAIQNRNLLLFFVATVMISLLLFVIRGQRARNRELLLKQAQQKANEDIYNLMLSQQNKIEEGRIKEKKRIAQELHDGVLGRLFGARLNLDSLNKLDGTAAEQKRNNYLTELKNIEQDIREISHDLNREKFVLINNFVAILNNLIEEQSNVHSASVSCTIDGKIKWKKIDNNLKINLYRITQEALQNINKYAQATTIKVELTEINNLLTLTISDNGIGFNTDKKIRGIGLQNMLSRAADCNGIFDIQSQKGSGTELKVSFPLSTKSAFEQLQIPQKNKMSV